MNVKKRYNRTALYFPDRLIEQLGYIPDYPFTIVEAPSGFGKTTALREYFSRDRQGNSLVLWYTFLGVNDRISWRKLCALMGGIDPRAAEALSGYGPPSVETLDEMFSLLEDIDFMTDTYLVIDNFQNLSRDLGQSLIRHFLENKNRRLHAVVVTQQVDAEFHNIHLTHHVLYIGASYFFFDAADTAAYYKSVGISLTAAETERLQKSTEGWITALYFQMLSYIEKGTFESSFGIGKLIESALWAKLGQQDKDLLISLSVFDGFAPPAIRHMADALGYPDDPVAFVSRYPFVVYDPGEGIFIVHDILKYFLRDKLDDRPAEFKNRILSLAGGYCANVRNYIPAIEFFRRTGDFEKILSMDFRGCEFSTDYEGAVGTIIRKIVEECPDGVLRRYPRSLLIFAFELLMLGEYEQYGRLCGILRGIFDAPGECCGKEFGDLYGDYNLLIAFSHYSDLNQFAQYLKKAFEYRTGPSLLFDKNDSWTAGVPSVMFQHYNRTGELWSRVGLLETALGAYSKLTDGHGSGADIVLKAEALYSRGELDSAEALCHKAILVGGAQMQDSVCIAADLTLARIAVCRGDWKGLKAARERIDHRSIAGTERRRDLTACLAQAFIAVTLGKPDDVPGWLLNTKTIRQRLYDRAVPFAFAVYMKQMVLKKEYARLLGVSGLFLNMAENMDCNLCRIYNLICMSIANEALGNGKKALGMLSKALDLALLDEVYMPFAENARYLMKNLELIGKKSDREEMKKLISLCGRVSLAFKTIGESIENEKRPDLTKREREIASFAAQGLTTKEIASRLFISSETVKSTLKTVFKKLRIRSRAELKNSML